jgi:hypothetical protein
MIQSTIQIGIYPNSWKMPLEIMLVILTGGVR